MMKRCKIWLKNQFGCMYNRGLWVLALLWMFQFRLMAQSGGGGQGGQGGQAHAFRAGPPASGAAQP